MTFRQEYPTRLIAENAGAEGSVVVGKLLAKADANHGFDAQTGSYTDMMKAGIIDPTKVVRLALPCPDNARHAHSWEGRAIQTSCAAGGPIPIANPAPI